jgi:hypothetical protein
MGRPKEKQAKRTIATFVVFTRVLRNCTSDEEYAGDGELVLL